MFSKYFHMDSELVKQCMRNTLYNRYTTQQRRFYFKFRAYTILPKFHLITNNDLVLTILANYYKDLDRMYFEALSKRIKPFLYLLTREQVRRADNMYNSGTFDYFVALYEERYTEILEHYYENFHKTYNEWEEPSYEWFFSLRMVESLKTRIDKYNIRHYKSDRYKDNSLFSFADFPDQIPIASISVTDEHRQYQEDPYSEFEYRTYSPQLLTIH